MPPDVQYYGVLTTQLLHRPFQGHISVFQLLNFSDMKTIKVYVAMLSAVLMLGSTVSASDATAQTRQGMSRKGKGAIIGGGTGAAAGAVIAGKGDRGKGALIGGAAGAVGGAIIGRKKDKRKDPVRYEQYSRKD
jgi:uncharacterized protein YcfJ